MPHLLSNRILQRYLIREWLRTFLPSLVCFEFLIFLGFTIQLLHKGLDIVSLKELITHLFIQALPYSIPPALLTATIMTYGRMSADREVIAIQASGIHINKITMPILIVGIIFNLITLTLYSEVVPRSYYKIKLLQERAINSILTRRSADFQKKLDLYPYHIYIGSVEDNKNKDITIIEYTDDYVINVILAKEGFVTVDESGNRILFTLQHGEFIKPNYKKQEKTPRLGVFDESVFEIPFNDEKRDSSTKYLTIPQLYKNNVKLRKIIKEGKASSDKTDRDKLMKQLSTRQRELDDLSNKRNMLVSELEQLNENSLRQKSKIDKFNNEIKIAQNYIIVSNENLAQLNRKNKIIPFINDDRDKKIMQTKETIKREMQRIETLGQNIKTAKKILSDEMKHSALLSQSLSDIDSRRAFLLQEIMTVKQDLNIANEEKLLRKNMMSLHRRLSQAFSCIIFIIIGIPLGIRVRSGNLMAGLGISFMVILLVYYPLVITGVVMAKDTLVPVIPAIWGADFILFLGGLFIFRKLFTQ
ncbi:MAG: LptF/LptG family permease [wastewater metagenome]|nr:LptF/LptG family permease [Candidatus Loosdrechtia aerotolerans]